MKLAFALVLAVAASTVGVGTALADQPVTVDPPATTSFAWPGSDANHEPYWETYFSNGYDCTKVDKAGAFTTTVAHDAIVAKGGQLDFIWQPGLADMYSTNPAVSHWFYCDGPHVEVQSIDPTGSIGGPCADPAYYGIFDNTASDMTILFRFRWYTGSGLHTVTKNVPAGAIFRTWEHWVKPFTTMRVAWKHPDTGVWIDAATRQSVRGHFPACVYHRGFEYPTT